MAFWGSSFPDIARPGVLVEHLRIFRCEVDLAVIFADAEQPLPGRVLTEGNSLARRSRRGGTKISTTLLGEPIVEILSKLARAHGRFEVPVGCRNDADVCAYDFTPSHPRELEILDDVQELGLQFTR